jgi:hypothetical protein
VFDLLPVIATVDLEDYAFILCGFVLFIKCIKSEVLYSNRVLYTTRIKRVVEKNSFLAVAQIFYQGFISDKANR